MRRMFLKNAMGHIVSALMPKETLPACLLEGETLTFIDCMYLDEGECIPAGTAATVLAHYISEDNGDCIVHLQLDAVRPKCLSEGLLILQPYSSDEALAAINGALKRNPSCVVTVGGEAPQLQRRERQKPWKTADLVVSVTEAEKRHTKYLQ